MKLDPHESHCLLDVNAKLQIDISKHVANRTENFHCRGGLLNSPIECFWPPEETKQNSPTMTQISTGQDIHHISVCNKSEGFT